MQKDKATIMNIDYGALVEQQKRFLNKVLMKDKLRFPLLFFSGRLRKVKSTFQKHRAMSEVKEEFLYLAQLIDYIDRNSWYRFLNKLLHKISDVVFELKYRNHTGQIKKEMQKQKDMYLSIVCIIKNEARYIREWIAYYKLMGVDHIYLFNNGSTDDIKSVLNVELQKGYVTLIDFTGANAQLPLYRLTANYLKGRCRWVAYIDADEFVMPSEGTLKQYMQTKEAYPAIGINWIVFGPGGHVERPEGLVTENYLQTFEDVNNLLNLRIKSIVNPSEVYDVTSPHFCILKKGRYAVDEEGEEISTKWMHVSGSGAAFTGENKTKSIRINHYWTKSQQDLSEKCNRGYAAGSFSPVYEDIMKRLDYPQKIDKTIEKWVPQIKKILEE